MITIQGKYTEAKVFTDKLEETARQQIQELCDLKAFEGAKVRVMPDTHAGKGCVIGFTAQLGDRIVPNLVGVDIGCGLRVVELGQIDIDFEELEKYIRTCVPHGKQIHHVQQPVPDKLRRGIVQVSGVTGSDVGRHLQSVGSLGDGNHFIEIDEDAAGNRYLVIHSGSRNLGAQVAKYHQKKAEEYCQSKLKELRNRQNRAVGLLKASGDVESIPAVIEEFKTLMEVYQVPKHLAFLEGGLAQDYLNDMYIAQDYAMENREHMARSIVRFLSQEGEGAHADFGYVDTDNLPGFTSVHNYTDPEDRVIRKGAIRADKGVKVIVPINMQVGSIIALGKGDADWNNSAPHGAGRVLSRTAAKNTLSLKDMEDGMAKAGVWTASVSHNTLDEAPGAYKSLEDIMEYIDDSLDVIEVIRSVYNFKA